MSASIESAFFPSRLSRQLEKKTCTILDVEEATGEPRLTTIDLFGPESRNGLLCAGDPVNNTDPDGTTVRFSGNSGAINTALNYLSGSSTFSGIYSTLVNSSQTYTINTNYSFKNGEFGPSIQGGGGTITWNPGLGLLVSSREGIMTAALVLAHELAHAFHYDTDPVGYGQTSNIRIPLYDNVAERIAVTWETLIARQLGEQATRADHRGDFVPVQSPSDPNAGLAGWLNSRSTAFVKYYLNGVVQFGLGWGSGSGLNPGSFGGASAAAVQGTLFQTLVGVPGGGGQPGEGSHPVPFELN